MNVKYAAVALCFNDEGKILLVTRPGKKDEYGIVGGKVDPYETCDYAALRELREETGYIGRNPLLVFKDWVRGEQDYFVMTYLVDIVGQSEKDLDPLEEGIQHIWEDFSLAFCGPFKEYNRKLATVLLDDYKNHLNEKIIHNISLAIKG